MCRHSRRGHPEFHALRSNPYVPAIANFAHLSGRAARMKMPTLRERRLEDALSVRRGRGVRGRYGHSHGRLQYNHLVHPCLCFVRPGGQALRPAGLHQDFRYHSLGDPVDHGGPDARLPSLEADPLESSQISRRRLAGCRGDDRSLMVGVPDVLPRLPSEARRGSMISAAVGVMTLVAGAQCQRRLFWRREKAQRDFADGAAGAQPGHPG